MYNVCTEIKHAQFDFCFFHLLLDLRLYFDVSIVYIELKRFNIKFINHNYCGPVCLKMILVN